MKSESHAVSKGTSVGWPWDLGREAFDYWIDAGQRWGLFLNVLGERTSRYQEHAARAAPHVLKFQCDLVMDGRKLARPVLFM